MRINTNVSAIIANNQLAKSEDKLSASLERLSSGLKINHSADDPAGMAISDKMRSQLKGLSQATNNAQDGISVIQTAEGSITEIQSMIQRMKELTVQAANDVNGDSEREAIQMEIDSLNKEIDRISEQTEFNTQPLINGNLERRVYSDVQGVKQIECSESFTAGKYGLTVTQDARQAIVTGDAIDTSAFTDGKVTKELAGSISINGYGIQIKEGDDLDTVMAELVKGAHSIDASIFTTDSTEVDTKANPDTAGYKPSTDIASGKTRLVIMSNEYGSVEKINVKCSNEKLAAALGISQAATQKSGIEAQGLDVKAEFKTENGKRTGFSDTAQIKTDGTKITVKDNGNKTFVVDVPGNVAGTSFDDSGKVATAKGEASSTDITQDVTDIGTMRVHIGANQDQIIELDIPEISSYKIGTDKVNVMSGETAGRSITRVDDALARVSEIRSKLGAYSNRLDHTTSNLSTSNENLTAALSRLVDTDMAEEMTEYTQMNVLVQAGTSMLSQANARPETVLQLLQK